MQEATRLWAAALAHATYGVNAQIPGITLSAGHSAPPDVAAIYTSDDDVRLAYGEQGESWPVLVVLDEDNGDGEGEVGTRKRDWHVELTTVYVPRDRDVALTYRNSSYTRRAIAKTLRDWLANASETDRTENGLYVFSALAMRRRPRTEEIRGIPHAGGLTVRFRVRDQQP